ncbi:nuclear transport factor 2 family protein [Paenibacillus sp. BC26]|uniref:nuclear transport factor 2 family protein n=1 Tax=Paenibacillus sp. BC26 TaxID=1881032 RepID=UPI0008E1AE2F|nr:nuclear transport factor 2 family protein [Paenibacillus sp. BC26]SFS54202.1 SnoaL-like domain-containing protein [Paenibacillus sp. BC26]
MLEHNQQAAARIAELEERLQRLEDTEQIKQLKARYFRFVDEKKWTEIGNLFTADAGMVSQGQDFSYLGGADYGKMIGDLVGKTVMANTSRLIAKRIMSGKSAAQI